MAEKLRSQIEALWNRLDVPEEERQEFLARTQGFKPQTIQTVSQPHFSSSSLLLLLVSEPFRDYLEQNNTDGEFAFVS